MEEGAVWPESDPVHLTSDHGHLSENHNALAEGIGTRQAPCLARQVGEENAKGGRAGDKTNVATTKIDERWYAAAGGKLAEGRTDPQERGRSGRQLGDRGYGGPPRPVV
jgi:hypothetical protein